MRIQIQIGATLCAELAAYYFIYSAEVVDGVAQLVERQLQSQRPEV